jgi:glycosyltransferase involved in cell wall biosynthesis
LSSDLTIVVPAYNEASALETFLPQLLEFCSDHGHRVILVNDGSRDGTADLLATYADRTELTVVTNKVNRGYGGAVKAGLTRVATEYAVTMDADGQHRLEDVTRLHDEIRATDADMIVGGRERMVGESRYRRVGKALIRRVAKVLMPMRIHDLNSGMRICRSRLVTRYLHLCPDSMAFCDIITLVFISQKHLVTESPIVVVNRVDGVSKANTMTAVVTVKELINIVVLFNPMKVFLPGALLLILGGIAWGTAAFVRYGQGVSVGATLAVVSGLLLFFLALIAEQLSSIRRDLGPDEP